MSSKPVPAMALREFSFPPGKRGRGTIICGILMLLSSRRQLLEPGSFVHDNLLSGQPTALKLARWAQKATFYILFGGHAIETVIFAATKLRKHQVPIMSLVWWKWVLSCFVGGMFVTKHFDDVAAGAGALGTVA